MSTPKAAYITTRTVANESEPNDGLRRLLSFKPSISPAERDAGLARRASWQYPAGITLIAEYWPASGATQVVSIFSADGYAPIMELVFEWNDVFDIDVSPAISAKEGLKLGAEVFGRLPRLQRG